MYIYKYCDKAHGLRILDTLRLGFTPPKYFNDVNEMSPYVLKSFSDAEYLSHFCTEDYLRPVFESWQQRHLWTGSYDKFAQEARRSETIRAEVAARVEKASTGLQRSFKEVMSDHTGVCCMAQIATSNLMWAHYADAHRGLCIQIALESSDLNLVDNRAVDYRDQKVQIPSWFMSLTPEQRNEYYLQVSFCKGTEWRYEREHRLVANLESCRTEVRGSRVDFYQLIDKADIKAVIVGIRSECQSEVRRILEERQIPAAVTRCVQADESFLITVTT